MDSLISSQDGTRLELEGRPLQEGDALEVCVIGSWVAGSVAHDQSGWSLTTTDRIPLRLAVGLLARFPDSSAPPLLSSSAD